MTTQYNFSSPEISLRGLRWNGEKAWFFINHAEESLSKEKRKIYIIDAGSEKQFFVPNGSKRELREVVDGTTSLPEELALYLGITKGRLKLKPFISPVFGFMYEVSVYSLDETVDIKLA